MSLKLFDRIYGVLFTGVSLAVSILMVSALNAYAREFSTLSDKRDVGYLSFFFILLYSFIWDSQLPVKTKSPVFVWTAYLWCYVYQSIVIEQGSSLVYAVLILFPMCGAMVAQVTTIYLIDKLADKLVESYKKRAAA